MEPSRTETTTTGEEAPRRSAVEAPAAVPDLEDHSLYFNRELSWLEFNDRVLQLAEDPSVPLLERAKFTAIWESNLDEFFMVRVADLHDQMESGIAARGADGMAPMEQLLAIRERVIAQRQRAGRCFERELRPALSEHGIRVISVDAASSEEVAGLESLFTKQVFPVLTPLVIGRGRPFPYISNLSLSLAVVLRDPDKDNEILARIKVPKELLGRFLDVGDGGRTLVTLDALIAANLGALFPGMEVLEHALFRVTRDTDYDVSDEADDMLQAVEEELRRRRFGEVVRLEVDAGMNPRLRDQLVAALGIEDHQVYEADGILDLADLAAVAGLGGHDELGYAPHNPVTPPRLVLSEGGKQSDVFTAIRAGDILVHHPYDSF
ncbi:MAG: RNA degradosome polyphosphate kinase, partial [Solirubrobacterales bacterium]